MADREKEMVMFAVTSSLTYHCHKNFRKLGIEVMVTEIFSMKLLRSLVLKLSLPKSDIELSLSKQGS